VPGPDDPVERFRLCCERLRLNNAFNGVIRASELKHDTALGLSGSDVALMQELSLYGKFIEVPERLFFRRGVACAFGRGSRRRIERTIRASAVPQSRARGRIRQLLSGVGRAPVKARTDGGCTNMWLTMRRMRRGWSDPGSDSRGALAAILASNHRRR
jgi:hypothetical protein